MRRAGVLPGFVPSLSVTLIYLGLLVVIPLLGLVAKAGEVSWDQLQAIIGNSRVQAAFRASFGCAAAAAVIDMGLGILIAWVLTRYRFAGRRLLEALIDLPFALPTAVAGVALATLYAGNGWFGRVLEPFGITVAYTPLGITTALAFVGLPFVVRTVQPVLADLDYGAQEVAMTLGARASQILWRVILPPLWPVVLTGGALAFARGLGEYGSVVFIAGNRPGISEIVPLLIIASLEEFDYPHAAVLGTLMMLLAFVLLLGIGLLQRWAYRHGSRP